jgi:hypothetical protein
MRYQGIAQLPYHIDIGTCRFLISRRSFSAVSCAASSSALSVTTLPSASSRSDWASAYSVCSFVACRKDRREVLYRYRVFRYVWVSHHFRWFEPTHLTTYSIGMRQN